MSNGVEAIDLERFREGLRHAAVRQGPLDRALRWLIRGGCWLVAWRVEATGFEALPRTTAGRPGAGCLVVPAPHRAWIDPFLLLAAWPPTAARLVWFGDGPTMTRSWWRRWLFPRLGMIPIAPDAGGPQAYADLAALVTAAGAALVIFPEKGPPSPPDFDPDHLAGVRVPCAPRRGTGDPGGPRRHPPHRSGLVVHGRRPRVDRRRPGRRGGLHWRRPPSSRRAHRPIPDARG